MSRIRHATETFVNQMIAAVKKLIESNTNEINVLSGQQNIRHYYSLSQIGLTDAQFEGLTQVQAFDLLVNTMRRYSILQIRCDSSLSNFREAIYQYSSRTSKGKGVIALLEVNVYANERYDARIIGEYTPTFLFECSGYPTTTSDWQQLATTSKTDILVTPTNGLKVTGNNVSFVEEIAGIKIYHGELEAAAPISDNPIVLTLPKFTSNTWRPVTFVKQDTKEAYGGWCYHGGQVRASLPAGKYNIDIIYT